MRYGHMVTHTYFSDDEYVYLNTDGNYWTADGSTSSRP
jgi:hypothetical protein